MAASKSQYYSGFDPRAIPCNVLWLDAADTNTLTLSGSNVLTWRDKSGFGYDASAVGTPTFVSNKLNGYGGILFTQTSGWMIGSASNTGSVVSGFVVADMSASAMNDARILSLGTIGSQDFDSALRSSFIIRTASTAQIRTFRNNVQLGVVNITYNTPFIGASFFTGASNTIFRDGSAGTTVASSGNFGYSNYGLGRDPGTVTTGRLHGHIHEVLLYNDFLDLPSRQAVEGYLAAKWGVQSNLPVVHPNRSLPPFLRPFVPPDISGCQLWLDAADYSSLDVSGSTVTRWRDKSGFSNDASGVGTPTYSNVSTFNPSIYMNGSSYYVGPVAITTTQATAAAVYRSTTTATTLGRDMRILSLATPSNGDFDVSGRAAIMNFQRSTYSNHLTSYRNNGFTSFTSAMASNTNYMGMTIYNGSVGLSFLNGVTGTSVGASTGTFAVSAYGLGNQAQGTSETFVGFMPEAMLYNTALTTVQRQTIEGYLAWKWRMINDISLAGTHPYRRNPPFSVAFNPRALSGCGLWLDANDTSSVVLSGSSVVSWLDKSGNNRHLTQATGGNRPTFVNTGLDSYVQFVASSSQFLDMSDAAGLAVNRTWSLFLVENRTSNNSPNYWFGGSTAANNSNLHVGYRNDSQATLAFYGNDHNASIPTYANDPNPRVWSMIYDGAIRRIVANGSNLSQAANTQNLLAWAGAAMGKYDATPFYFNGRIREVLWYTPALTSNQQLQVEGYLAHKWKLDGSFNVGHPYRAFTP